MSTTWEVLSHLKSNYFCAKQERFWLVKSMSLAARRQLIAGVRQKYRNGSWSDKGKILDGFVAATVWLECLPLLRKSAGDVIDGLRVADDHLLFAYILFLIGRVNYKANDYALKSVIAKWFFMSALTRRYTGSLESQMEFDLARLRSVEDGEAFLLYSKLSAMQR